MPHLKPLTLCDVAPILEWNRNTDADWLYQWAGRGYSWPLTAAQLSAKLANGAQIWRIEENGEMIGTIELAGLVSTSRTASVCRFLIAPQHRCRGLGQGALELLCAEAFGPLGLTRLDLRVFDFNAAAIQCYRKAGFREVNRLPNAWRDQRRDCGVVIMVREP